MSASPRRTSRPVTTAHAMWLLFAWVAANQGGVPIPVVPSLIGAGALAGAGHASLVTVVAVAVGASLTADLAWYSIGRWRGAQALAFIGKLGRQAAARARIAEQRFVAHRVGVLFGARWLPEVNPLAAVMAGAAGIAAHRYMVIAMTSALAWVGTWTALGYTLGNVATRRPMPFGVVTTFISLALAIASIGFVLKHRRRRAKRPRGLAGDAMPSAPPLPRPAPRPDLQIVAPVSRNGGAVRDGLSLPSRAASSPSRVIARPGSGPQRRGLRGLGGGPARQPLIERVVGAPSVPQAQPATEKRSGPTGCS
jgi:membrane protein DedA with SNARE-associated domain